MKITMLGVGCGLGFGLFFAIENIYVQSALVLFAMWCFGTASYEEQKLNRK